MIGDVILNLEPLIAAGFPPSFDVTSSLWFQVKTETCQMPFYGGVTFDVRPTPCEDYIQAGPIRMPTPNIPTTEPRFDELRTIGIFVNQP